MEIEPWMLVLYMICGICFFVFLSVKITPRFAKKSILNGLKSEEGKEIMHEVVLNAIESLNDEIEIPGPPGEDGKPTMIKTTIGAMVMNSVGSAVVKHFKMTFLGEKGRMSKELQNAEMDMMMQGMPEQLQGIMPMIFPMIKKHPLIGGLIGMALPALMSKMSPTNQPNGGTGQNGYGNCSIPY